MIFGTALCLGDSLTRGARAHMGYPELLVEILTARTGTYWSALNKGVSGETTWQVLDRTPAAVAQLGSQPGAKWTILLAGTNDSKPGGAPIDEWEALYRQVVLWPMRIGSPLALCTFPTVLPGVMPSYNAGSVRYLREASERVRAIVRELGTAHHVRLVELEDMPEDLLCDGVHMTSNGYAWVAERVADTLTTPG